MATWNPAMKSAHIEFKYLMGGTIAYKMSDAATQQRKQSGKHHRRHK